MCKFPKALQILKSLNSPSRIINRDRINFTKLMHLLQDPYNNFKSIHITGTNGKGSVAIKTSKILQYAGHKTGTYISPHLFTLRQRIQVNGEYISRDSFSDKVLRIQQIVKKENLALSFFEYVTAVGFLEFKEKGCQYVGLEVGLGGKNDTTNIVNPEVSVITSIGLDHMDLLGNTKQDIARQKAGIIKPNRPVVLGPNALGYRSIEQAIKQNNSKVYRIEQSTPYKDFESQNNSIVLQTIACLKDLNPNLKISEQNIQKGLNCSQPCRMQKLDDKYIPQWAKNKTIYFDVGHNVQAIQQVIQYLEAKGHKKQDICWVFGTSKGKKFDDCLALIEKACRRVYLISANHYRACPITQLQNYVGSAAHPGKFVSIADGNIAKTLQIVTALQDHKVVVISGSFFIMPEARGFFQPQLVSHPQENINQVYQLKQKK